VKIDKSKVPERLAMKVPVGKFLTLNISKDNTLLILTRHDIGRLIKYF